MADPSPAPAWMRTSWPWSASSRTPDGVSATRYSSVLISVGAPTFIWGSSSSSLSWRSLQELPPAQGEPEVDAVARRVQRAARELLDPADPVAQRVAMTEQLLGGPLPLPVALDEDLERAHQLAAVGALTRLDRRQDRVAEQPHAGVVLQREQQLEGAQVAVGRQPVAVPVGLQRDRLERP